MRDAASSTADTGAVRGSEISSTGHRGADGDEARTLRRRLGSDRAEGGVVQASSSGVHARASKFFGSAHRELRLRASSSGAHARASKRFGNSDAETRMVRSKLAMRGASVLSTRAHVTDAVEEAADRLLASLGTFPDVLFVFASNRLRGNPRVIPPRASARLGAPLVCGCTGEGVLAEGREHERSPALAMLGLALPDGARAQPLRVEAGARTVSIGAKTTGVVLLSDPFSADLEGIVRRFDASFPGVSLVGGLASGARRPGEHSLFLEGWTFHDGAVGVALSGPVRIDGVVAQSCRPIGEPMIVTRADGPRILELDRGRPGDVVRDLAASMSGDERRRMLSGLLCGVQMRDSQIEYGPGDFLIRDVLKVEQDGGAMVVAAELEGYPVVQLHLRDAATSTADLRRALARDHDAHGSALGVLMFSGLDRGVALHGEPGHDSTLVTERFGPVPVGGFFCDGEIGPVGGTTYLHTRTSAIGVLRATPRTPRAPRE